MKKQVNPIVATIVILGAMMAACFVIWKLNEDKPIPEGPGVGRIGQTFDLSKGAHKPGAGGKSGAPAHPEAKPAKPGS